MTTSPSGTRERALELVAGGASMRAAGRAVGVSHNAVRGWLGKIPQEKRVEPEAVQAGLQELREQVFRGITARVLESIAGVSPGSLKDLLMSYGIADDKMMGRSPGGAHASASAFAGLIVVHSDVPRPAVTALPERE